MFTPTCPAILIAPASGKGKTTVACALARLHARQGRQVRVFKCGPDFLDPYWLTLASAQQLEVNGGTLRGEGEALYVSGPTGSVRASYFHAWFASSPAAAARLFLKDNHD